MSWTNGIKSGERRRVIWPVPTEIWDPKAWPMEKFFLVVFQYLQARMAVLIIRSKIETGLFNRFWSPIPTMFAATYIP